MTASPPLSWLPFAIAEASLTGTASGDRTPVEGWSYLLERMATSAAIVETSGFARNRTDLTAGIRHLLVLLAVGIDEALRVDPDPALRVERTSTDDIITWGMECPDCLYTRALMRGGESYRLHGNRGTARYVGLQTMNGVSATANAVVDELEVDAAGNFEVVLSAKRHAGNWLRTEGAHPTLTVRHFFYDWDTEVPSTLNIERIGESANEDHPQVDPELAVSRQLAALGDFVHDNLKFFLDFGSAPPTNGFLPAIDRSSMGAAAENRPVIGRYELEPDEALILEVQPPEGLYWSYSVGNPWWETIHYGRHQSSLNGHQIHLDADGAARVVLCATDPGIANWLDTAGHSNGAMILRCVRTETAPTPHTRVVKFDDLASSLPPDTRRVSPDERSAVLAARRQAIANRFANRFAS
ncbi:MAG: DUF1214 domain-containing protein [Mycobacterium sp.]